MSFLSSATLDLLRMASILGSTFSVRDLTLVMECSARTLAPMIREAIEAGVLAEAGARITFRHDLLREGAVRGHAALGPPIASVPRLDESAGETTRFMEWATPVGSPTPRSFA